jgi:hypothetical protein
VSPRVGRQRSRCGPPLRTLLRADGGLAATPGGMNRTSVLTPTRSRPSHTECHRLLRSDDCVEVLSRISHRATAARRPASSSKVLAAPALAASVVTFPKVQWAFVFFSQSLLARPDSNERRRSCHEVSRTERDRRGGKRVDLIPADERRGCTAATFLSPDDRPRDGHNDRCSPSLRVAGSVRGKPNDRRDTPGSRRRR